jgi:hypothetical protein
MVTLLLSVPYIYLAKRELKAQNTSTSNRRNRANSTSSTKSYS